MDRKKKILVVEDDRLWREMIGRILTNNGYEVIFAEDGKVAIEKAASEKPDLVLTDGLLPKLHGFLVCKAIKDMPSPPKVIVLTGVYTKPTYKWQAKREYGADELLSKPANAAELLACIDRVLAQDDESIGGGQEEVLSPEFLGAIS
jgi:DNA-binding response OmpR family regulator